MVKIKIVHQPKIYDKNIQEDIASKFFSYFNYIVTTLLDERDIVSFSTTKKLYESMSFVFMKSKLPFVNEATSIRMLQLVINCANIYYQYLYSSWTTYLLTTFSGLKKIYKCIFENPLYGVMWYLTFYLNILGTTDQKTFDLIGSKIKLPKYSDVILPEYMETLAVNIIDMIKGNMHFDISSYEHILLSSIGCLKTSFSMISVKTTNFVIENVHSRMMSGKPSHKALKTSKSHETEKIIIGQTHAENIIKSDNIISISYPHKVSSQNESKKVEDDGKPPFVFMMTHLIDVLSHALQKLSFTLAMGGGASGREPGSSKPSAITKKVDASSVSQSLLVKNQNFLAKEYPVYLEERNSIFFDSTQFDEHLKYLHSLKSENNIFKKIVKRSVYNPKDKRSKTKVKQTLTHLRDTEGNVLCLDECKPRVKTLSGAYCSSECGKSSIFSSKEWCYIDPVKNKSGKTRDTYLGRPYDLCVPSKGDPAEGVCFTGLKYSKCTRTKK